MSLILMFLKPAMAMYLLKPSSFHEAWGVNSRRFPMLGEAVTRLRSIQPRLRRKWGMWRCVVFLVKLGRDCDDGVGAEERPAGERG